jgi:TetR/AcrR family transcriptional regulator, upper aerobic nicotinate degradation pathway regulator
MKLVMNEHPSPEKSEATRDLLIRAAKTVFAKHGFEGATVKQIAMLAGVNVSLVSYHFNGKEGLYRACFEELGLQRLAATERLLKAPASAEDFRVRLQLFAEDFFLWNLEENDVCTILHRECGGEMPLTKDIFRNTFLKSFQHLADFFRVG